MSSLRRFTVGTACLLVAIAACTAGSTPLLAQTSNGTIAGVVTDPSGAAVTTAKVTATSMATGEVRTVQTNSVGAYRIESVLPGVYKISVSAPNFGTTNLENVQVVASTVTSINAQLKVGSASEVVTVEAQGELLQTETGEVSKTISTTEINNLPIGTLNPYQLATTLPGVVTGAANNFSNGTNFSVNGNRSRANNFLIEGQDNNDAGIAGQGMQPANLDAVSQVSVMTNAYGAEFGRGGGSVSNLVMKSGTNAFHGSLWELHASSALDANTKWNDRVGNPKGKYHENTYGFSLGGPIVKEKAFFFFSWQWDKNRSSTNGGNIVVLTPNGIATLQGLLPAASTSQKAQINTLLQVYNQPTLHGPFNNVRSIALGLDPNTGVNRGSVEVGTMNRQGIPAGYDAPEVDAKGDWLINSNNTLGLRFIRTFFTTGYDLGNFPNQLPGFDTQQNGPAYNAGITYTRVFTPTLVNELRVSYGRIGFTFDWRPDTYANPLVDNGNKPAVGIGGAIGLTGFGPPGSTPQGRFHNTYQLQDSVSWSTGKHTFKFGFDMADIRIVDTMPFGNYFGSILYADSSCSAAVCGTAISYTGLANFIDGFGGGNASASQTFGSNKVHSPQKSQSYFVQDSWKVLPNLTATLGVRYEYTAPIANDIPYPAMNINDPAPANYPQRILQKPDRNNVGPRVGFAYTPRFARKIFGDSKTVIRGGAGAFFDHGFTNILDNTASGAPNDVPASIVSRVNATNPRGVAGWNWGYVKPLLSPVLNPFSGVTSMDANIFDPETYGWNLSVQRELPLGLAATVGYVGSRGTHLYATDVLNPYINDPNNPLFQQTCGNGATYCRVYSNRGGITIRDNLGDSNYHSLQAEVARKMSHGLEMRVNYTWSKTIDDVSEVFTSGNYSTYPIVQYPNPRGTYDRGLSAMDRRQRLVIVYVYSLPHLRTVSFKDNPVLGVLGQAYSGWQIAGTTSFQSGAPGNVQTGYWLGSYDWNWDGIGNDRPMLGNPAAPITTFGVMEDGTVCDGPAYTTGPNAGVCSPVDPSSVHWIAADLFKAGATNPVSRNSYITPGRQDWTFSLQKAFKITESHKLEYKMEMFNPFNHANTGVPTLTLGTGIPRPGQGDITFGDLTRTVSGARSIRMWLKYSF